MAVSAGIASIAPSRPLDALAARQDCAARTALTASSGSGLACRWRSSHRAGLAMAFKLIQAAQDHWGMVNAPHLVALVRAGATFVNGKLVERPAQEAQPEAS